MFKSSHMDVAMVLACRLIPVLFIGIGFVELVAVVAVGEYEKVGEVPWGTYCVGESDIGLVG